MTTPIEQLAFRPGRPANPTKHQPADVTTINAVLGNWTSDVVNVKNYGALGDGSTDDTAKIQAAFNDAFGMAQFTGVISGSTLTATSIVGAIFIGASLSYDSGGGHGGVTITADLGGGQYTLSFSAGPISSQPMMTTAGQGNFNYPVRKVYIPAGNYITTKPLYILGVLGAHVYGAGNGATQIFYTADGTQKNVLNNAGASFNNVWTPVIALDGVAYSKFEGFDIGTFLVNAEQGLGSDNFSTVTPVPRMTGIMVYQSAPVGTTSAILFENMNISNMWCGMAAVQGGGNVENCIVLNVGFATCGQYGLYLGGQNVVNWQVYGGGCSNTGWQSTFVPGAQTGDIGVGYYAGVGGLGCLYGISCTGNQWDVFNNGQQMHIAGGSFEGGPTLHCTLSWSSAAGGTATVDTSGVGPHKLKFDQPVAIFQSSPSGYDGHYTAHITSTTTFTFPLAVNPGSSGTGQEAPTNAGCICSFSCSSVDAIAYRVGDSAYSLPFYCQGQLIVNGSLISAAHSGGAGLMSWMSNGTIQFNGCIFQSYDTSTFKSAGASELYLRGIQYIAVPTSPFSAFTGRVREYDKVLDTTVSALPTAATNLTGLRGSVTDGAASLAWGATVTGGGSAFYQVVCNGSAWTVTGK
jgi:hypothetical protein